MTESSDVPILRRFSSRHGRLSHVFLKDRLQNAREYRAEELVSGASRAMKDQNGIGSAPAGVLHGRAEGGVVHGWLSMGISLKERFGVGPDTLHFTLGVSTR